MNARSSKLISGLAVLGIILTLAASMWRLWNWPILAAVINAKITAIIPQIQATDSGDLSISGVDAKLFFYAAILIGAVTLVLVRRFQVADRRFWIALLPPVLVMILAGLSVSWSVAPAHTSSQLLSFFALTIAALLFGLASREDEILLALEVFSAGVILASLIALLRYPHPTGATMVVLKVSSWRGIFIHKNYLGLTMALANAVFLLRAFHPRRQHWIWRALRLSGFALALFMLFRTNARTSLLVLIAMYVVLALGFAYLKWGHRLSRKHWILLTSSAVAGLALLWIGRRSVLALLGRNATLTGRTWLWRVLAGWIAHRPVLGFGFGQAFWIARKGRPFRNRPWLPSQAHNMYIDFALSLGWVGLVLLLILILETLVLDLRYFLRARSVLSLWPLLLLAVVVIAGMAESFLASNTYFLWTLLILAFGFTLRAGLAPAEPMQAPMQNDRFPSRP